jgi:GT2 family glycosyltransferase
MEDADICRRLRSVGFVTLLQPATTVIHNAQRRSRRNLRYLAWHLGSAFRFLFLPEKTI